MADILRIKRRAVGGAAGAPASLAAAEMAFNEQTNILYYGGGNSAGLATSIFPIAGPGAFAPLASPIFTGVPAGPTAAPGTNTTQFATTAFVTAADIASAGVTTFNTRAGAVTLAAADITGAGGALLASPTFTGTPTLPTGTVGVTQAVGDEDTSLATVQFVAREAAGYLANNIADADATWTTAQTNARIINVTSTLTADRTVTIPVNAMHKAWVLRNGTVGGFNTVIAAGTNSYSIPAGYAGELWSSGASLFPAQNILLGATARIGDATRNALQIATGLPTAATVISSTGTGLIQLSGGVIFGGGGIQFGSVLAAGGPSDLSSHINLWGTSYGFSVTSARLNHVGGSHFFVVAGVDVGSITSTGLNATAVGATTPSSGAFTTLSATGTVSGAGVTALLAPYALLASPTFTGTPTLPTGTIGVTQVAGTNSTTLATTAFVQAANAAAVLSFNTRVGAVVLTAADVTGVGGALLASPSFTGTPLAPTAAPGTNTTQLATTAFVSAAAALLLPLTGGVISNGLQITGTTGGGGIQQLLLSATTSQYGLIVNGTYTANAIRLLVNQSIGFIATANRNLYYDNVNDLPAGLKWSTAGQAAPNPVITLGDTGLITCLAGMGIDNAAGTNRGIQIRTAGLMRWWLLPGNPTAEVGANAGTDCDLVSYDDTGAILVNPVLRITRSTGLATFNRGVSTTTLVATSTVSGAGFTTLLAPYAPLASPTFTGVPSGPTAAPGTNTTQYATTAFVTAADIVAAGVTTFNTRAGAVTLTNADVTAVLLPSATTPLMDGTAAIGVGTTWAKADHVHPTDSTRAPLLSPALTGVPTVPTASLATNTTQAASTAYVMAALVAYAPLASPTFTGIPVAPTALANTNTTQIATTAFVQAANAAAVLSFNTRVGAVVLTAADVTGVGGALLAGPTFTGVPAAPTAAALTSTTQLATTAFVTTADNLKANLASPTFTGIPAVPNAAVGDESTTIASTLFAARTAQGLNQPSPGDADTTLTAAQLDGGIINIIGTLTADRTYTVPMNLNRRVWRIRNGTTGGFNTVITCSGGTSFTIPTGLATEIWTNSFNIFSGSNFCCNTTFRVGDTTRNSLLITTGLAAATTTINTLGTGILQFSCGIAFGNIAAATNTDLTNHISLYSTSYGFSVSSNRLNYVAPQSHRFIVGTTDIVSILAPGVTISPPTSTLWSTYGAGQHLIIGSVAGNSNPAIGIGDVNGTNFVALINSGGGLTIGGMPALNNTTTAISNRLSIAASGITAWIPLVLQQDPTTDQGAATKRYVDQTGGSQNTGRNVIHNALFNIAQRGGGPFTGVGNFTLDRWQMAFVGTGATSSVSQSNATTQGTTIGNEYFEHFLIYTFTGTSGTSDNNVLVQHIESARRLSGQTVSVSFWAWVTSGANKTIGCSINQNFGQGGSPSAQVNGAGQSIAVTVTPTRYQFQIAVASVSGKVFGTTPGTDFTEIMFWFSAGSAQSTASGATPVQTGQINLWGVQVEFGTSPSLLEQQDPADDFAKCQRFYQIGTIQAQGYAANPGNMIGSSLGLPVTMKRTPTVTVNWTTQTLTTTASLAALGPSAVSASAAANANGNVNIVGSFTLSADI